MSVLDYYYNDPNKQCSTRDIKGYLGELFVKHGLDTLGLTYTSNPLLSITDWKQYQNSGVDFKLYNVQLEVKNTEARVFRSWIRRDWIPRFTYNNETRIVVCPSSIKLSTNVLELLFIHNINILYFDSLRYLKNNIQKNDANKLVLSSNIECTSSSEVPIEVYNDFSSKRILSSSFRIIKQSVKHSLKQGFYALGTMIKQYDANKLNRSSYQYPTEVSYYSSRISSKRILNSSSRIVKQSMKQSIRAKLQGFKAILKHQLSKDTLNLLRRLWSAIQCRIDQVDQYIKYAYKHTIIRLLHRNTILHLLHRIDQVDLKSKVHRFYNKLEEVFIGGR